jgi:hypothetical protein
MSLWPDRHTSPFTIVPREHGRTLAYSVLGILGPIPNWAGLYNARDILSYLAVSVAVATQGAALDEASRLGGDPVKSRTLRAGLTGLIAAVTGVSSSALAGEGITTLRPTDALFAGLAGAATLLLGATRMEEAAQSLTAITGKVPDLEGMHLNSTASFSYQTEVGGRPARVTVDFLDSPAGQAFAAQRPDPLPPAAEQ